MAQPYASGLPGEVSDADRLASAAFELAKRFARGATLWCAAPEWPWHAQHVAVEFVHPVIVGKRALPAVALGRAKVVEELRALSRSGDIFVGIASVGDEQVRSATKLAEVWGLLTVRIGAGEGAEQVQADHVLWMGADAEEAAFDGSFVRAYHLLWELCHVCFEHPGLLAEQDACDDSDHCITCSDEGRLAEVLSVSDDGIATVRSSRGTETVDAALIDAPEPGDLVLLHAGSVLAKVEGGR